MTRHT